MGRVLHHPSALPVPFYRPSPPPRLRLRSFNSSSFLFFFFFFSSFFFFPLRDRKHPREVDARGEALLSQRPHHPGGEQEGLEER